MRREGMTLLEVMFSVSIFAVVMGTIFGLAFSFGETAELHQSKATANDEARRLIQALIPDLRQAARSSINWAELPGETLTYRVAADVDANGAAVDVSGRIELSTPRVVMRDIEDINGDGLTADQIIVVSNGAVRVLANEICPVSEEPDAAGVFSPSQDVNGNARMDRGIWFEPWGRGIRITVQAEGTDREGHTFPATYQEVVFPRN